MALWTKLIKKTRCFSKNAFFEKEILFPLLHSFDTSKAAQNKASHEKEDSRECGQAVCNLGQKQKPSSKSGKALSVEDYRFLGKRGCGSNMLSTGHTRIFALTI